MCYPDLVCLATVDCPGQQLQLLMPCPDSVGICSFPGNLGLKKTFMFLTHVSRLKSQCCMIYLPHLSILHASAGIPHNPDFFPKKTGLYPCLWPAILLYDIPQEQLQPFLEPLICRESNETPPRDLCLLLLQSCSKSLWEISLCPSQTQRVVTSPTSADSSQGKMP